MQVIIFLSLLLIACARASYNETLVYTWVTVDYDWPNATMKRDYQKSDRHIVENNIIAGIKVSDGHCICEWDGSGWGLRVCVWVCVCVCL